MARNSHFMDQSQNSTGTAVSAGSCISKRAKNHDMTVRNGVMLSVRQKFEGERLPGVGAQFVEDVGGMAAHCMRAQKKLRGYRIV